MLKKETDLRHCSFELSHSNLTFPSYMPKKETHLRPFHSNDFILT